MNKLQLDIMKEFAADDIDQTYNQTKRFMDLNQLQTISKIGTQNFSKTDDKNLEW